MSNLPPPAQPQSTPAPTSRRGAGARKRAAQADDAAYHAAAGTKRGAPERADGDRDRVKRKRVDASAGGVASGADKEDKGSLVSLVHGPHRSYNAAHSCFGHVGRTFKYLGESTAPISQRCSAPSLGETVRVCVLLISSCPLGRLHNTGRPLPAISVAVHAVVLLKRPPLQFASLGFPAELTEVRVYIWPASLAHA